MLPPTQEFCAEFEGREAGPQLEADQQAKAYAWYYAAYQGSAADALIQSKSPSNRQQRRDWQHRRSLFSFGWIPFRILLGIKQQAMERRRAAAALAPPASQECPAEVRGGGGREWVAGWGGGVCRGA